MRTKQVKISDAEREFQIGIDRVVRSYEARIREMTAVCDSLKKIRKCQYCGGTYYAKGLCVNCYNVMRRAKGDVEEFEKRRQRYGYRSNKSDNWMGNMYSDLTGESSEGIKTNQLKKWYSDFTENMNEEDKTVLELHYRDGWSFRGCSNIMNKDKGWVCSRINSMRTSAKKILKKTNKSS